MFCSLLVTDGFPADVRQRIEEALAPRDVLGDEARRLLDRHDRNGGLDADEGAALVGECVGRIFAWTGRGGPHELYRDLVAADMRIAADIACFPSHHLNHLAFNSLAIDLVTAAMRRCLAERDDAWFRAVDNNGLFALFKVRARPRPSPGGPSRALQSPVRLRWRDE